MPYGDQVSRPQQDPSSGRLLPPANLPERTSEQENLRKNREWMDHYMKEQHPGVTTGPNPPPPPPQPPSSEELIRQDRQMRTGQGMWPTPRQPGPLAYQREYIGETPVVDMAIAENERRTQFPEMFGQPYAPPTLPEQFKQEMFHEYGIPNRDIQRPYNSGLPFGLQQGHVRNR